MKYAVRFEMIVIDEDHGETVETALHRPGGASFCFETREDMSRFVAAVFALSQDGNRGEARQSDVPA